DAADARGLRFPRRRLRGGARRRGGPPDPRARPGAQRLLDARGRRRLPPHGARRDRRPRAQPVRLPGCSRRRVRSLRGQDRDRRLESGLRVSFDQYVATERVREARIDASDYQPVRDALYEAAYAGQGWLVLEAVEGYRRTYGRS